MQASEATGMFPRYLNFSDKPYSTYKPGQASLERDYFSKATNEQPDGTKNLKNYARFGTDYT
jgi:hypothetical protein